MMKKQAELLNQLTERAEALRAKPLKVLCKTPDGAERIMTIEQCITAEDKYIQLVCDDLDKCLAQCLEGKD